MKQSLALLGLTLSLFANTALAGIITYSWGGLLERSTYQSDDPDPFNFGGDGSASPYYKDYSEGSRFELNIALDSLAKDTNTIDGITCSAQTGLCYDVPEAEYAVSNVTLTINGSVWLPEEGTSTLNFSDNVGQGDGRDRITFHGEFSLPEGVLDFRSSVTLADEAFALTPLSVNPVPLSSGIYSNNTYIGFGSSQYTSRTYEDLTIVSSAVPEPSSSLILAFGLVCLIGISMRWKAASSVHFK